MDAKSTTDARFTDLQGEPAPDRRATGLELVDDPYVQSLKCGEILGKWA